MNFHIFITYYSLGYCLLLGIGIGNLGRWKSPLVLLLLSLFYLQSHLCHLFFSSSTSPLAASSSLGSIAPPPDGIFGMAPVLVGGVTIMEICFPVGCKDFCIPTVARKTLKIVISYVILFQKLCSVSTSGIFKTLQKMLIVLRQSLSLNMV